jgi:glutathione synthase/RimK-type ligase-like ATP-grasp enzyme
VTSEALPNLYEDDLFLVKALDAIGIDSRPAIWSDATIDWNAFDAIVIRTPWDYFKRIGEFRAWLDARIASGVLMCNDAAILDWNFDKAYLRELATKGAVVIPTEVIARGETADVGALAKARGWDDVVVKPTISGGGYRTYRFRADDAERYRDQVAEILAECGLMIQPFLPEIHEGELALLFFDGEYSHAVRKLPAEGDYRVQFQYGGTDENAEPRPEWIEGARACVRAAPRDTVYARVDGVIKDGELLLMELEVFEPLMFLARHPDAAAKFARAIAKRVDERITARREAPPPPPSR